MTSSPQSSGANASAGIVSPKIAADAAGLCRRFVCAQPFPHVVIDDFFDAGFVAALLAEFPPFASGNTAGDYGAAGGKSTFERVRTLGPAFSTLDATIASSSFLELVSRLTGIEALIYDPWYLGGGTHENRDGQYLSAHVDFNYHPSERWHRRLNLIVYLDAGWEPAWGGNLQLFGDPYADAEPAVVVPPAQNRCVIFETSERSWHGFDRICLPPHERHRSRRSIALYFYSKERPADEIAPKHSTHYVNRQLPRRFEAGYRLGSDDVALLKELLARRDHQLRDLYAENTRLLQAQERGLTGHLIYLAKRLYVRFRR